MAEERQVLYGSLYLDRGERMAKAKEQIDSFRKMNAVGFYFDVIYGLGQETLGAKYADRVQRYAEKHLTCPVSVSATFAKTPEADPRCFAAEHHRGWTRDADEAVRAGLEAALTPPGTSSP